MFFGRTDAEAGTRILWPPDRKSRLIGKDPDAGKDRMQEEKGTTEDEGWMALQLEGHEFEQTQGDSEGQRSLACCSPQGHKESDMNTFVTITQSDSPRFVTSNTQRTRIMILLTQLFCHILQQNTGSFRF